MKVKKPLSEIKTSVMRNLKSKEYLCERQRELDFLKVVRLVFWSGVVGPGTSFRSLALRAQKLDL